MDATNHIQAEQSLINQVKSVIEKKLDIPLERIRDHSDLQADLGADSLDAVEIVMELEKHFQITISDDEAKNLKTVKDICEFLAKRSEK